MIKKIVKSSYLFLLSIVITTSLFFSGSSQVNAVQVIQGDNVDNTPSKEIKNSSEMINSPKTVLTPDLGDDQAFPFIPGFGKNSGKD